jgi:hypothetical protein
VDIAGGLFGGSCELTSRAGCIVQDASRSVMPPLAPASS